MRPIFKTSSLLITFTSLCSTSASAGFNGPAFGSTPVESSGSGCPAGTAHSVLAPDGNTISILFDKYQVEAGKTTGHSNEKKDCAIKIPVALPTGYTFGQLDTDFRGFLAIPGNGGKAKFNADHEFSPAFHSFTFGNTHREFKGSQNQDFSITTHGTGIEGIRLCWGLKLKTITIKTNLETFSNANGESSLATIDSADTGGAAITLRARPLRCLSPF